MFEDVIPRVSYVLRDAEMDRLYLIFFIPSSSDIN